MIQEWPREAPVIQQFRWLPEWLKPSVVLPKQRLCSCELDRGCSCASWGPVLDNKTLKCEIKLHKVRGFTDTSRWMTKICKTILSTNWFLRISTNASTKLTRNECLTGKFRWNRTWSDLVGVVLTNFAQECFFEGQLRESWVKMLFRKRF